MSKRGSRVEGWRRVGQSGKNKLSAQGVIAGLKVMDLVAEQSFRKVLA